MLQCDLYSGKYGTCTPLILRVHTHTITSAVSVFTSRPFVCFMLDERHKKKGNPHTKYCLRYIGKKECRQDGSVPLHYLF